MLGHAQVQKPLTAYNLTVENFATFFVAANIDSEPVWVHNCPGNEKGPGRSDHAEQRRLEDGRPVSESLNDLQNARDADIFVQEDGRFVVRGRRGREHIFESDGELVTTVNRTARAHRNLVGKTRTPATSEQANNLRGIFRQTKGTIVIEEEYSKKIEDALELVTNKSFEGSLASLFARDCAEWVDLDQLIHIESARIDIAKVKVCWIPYPDDSRFRFVFFLDYDTQETDCALYNFQRLRLSLSK